MQEKRISSCLTEKEELVLQGDIAAKNRHISKGLGNLTGRYADSGSAGL